MYVHTNIDIMYLHYGSAIGMYHFMLINNRVNNLTEVTRGTFVPKKIIYEIKY